LVSKAGRIGDRAGWTLKSAHEKQGQRQNEIGLFNAECEEQSPLSLLKHNFFIDFHYVESKKTSNQRIQKRVFGHVFTAFEGGIRGIHERGMP